MGGVGRWVGGSVVAWLRGSRAPGSSVALRGSWLWGSRLGGCGGSWLLSARKLFLSGVVF